MFVQFVVVLRISMLLLKTRPIWRQRMAMFSDESRSKLSTCHIDLQVIFFEVIKHFDCTVLEGHRNEIEQNRAFERGRSKLKWPLGKHNSSPALAVDVAPHPINWDNRSQFLWFGGFVLGIVEGLKIQQKITHSVRWGGDWNCNFDVTDEKGLSDLCHFEIIT
jgi:peptidoglycan LD-endopeptidase CwlK